MLEYRDSDFVLFTKLDAARDQLYSAIKFHFDGESIASVHTLANAAFMLLRDLQKGRPDSIFEQVLGQIAETDRKEFFSGISEPGNFFKHADNDSQKTLRISPVVNDAKILFACQIFVKLVPHPPAIVKGFMIWFRFAHPKMFSEKDDVARVFGDFFKETDITKASRPELLSLGRKLIEKIEDGALDVKSIMT